MIEFFLIFTASVFCDIVTLFRNKRFFSITKRKYDIILILICEGIRYNHAVTDTVHLEANYLQNSSKWVRQLSEDPDRSRT